MKKAFTLAEIMIVLTVIGVLSAILLPVAFHSAPDENVMKFKKAHNTLSTVIRELVNSDRYYSNGDLGVKSDGTPVINNGNTVTYFCETFADVLSTKSVKCANDHTVKIVSLINGQKVGNTYVKAPVTNETLQDAKNRFDEYCKKAAIHRGKEIVAADDTVFYRVNNIQYGSFDAPNADGTYTHKRFGSPPDQNPANYGDENGFDVFYLPLCMDIDGFDESKGSEDCDDVKDICPFGYGVRTDGKILAGNRADEWLKKSIQAGD